MKSEEIRESKLKKLGDVLKGRYENRELAVMSAMTIELIELNYKLSILSDFIGDDLEDIKEIIRKR